MKRLLIFSASVLLSTSVHGQEVRSIVARSLCFSHVDKLKEVQFLNPGKAGELTPIPLWKNEPSEDIPLKIKGGEVQFVIPEQGADGKPGYKVVAKGKLGTSKRQLFYFLPGDKGGPTYTVRCFNDDEQSFPMGSSRVVNLTERNAAVTFGEHKVKVKPGAVKVIPIPKNLNSYGDYNRVVELETKEGRLNQVANNRGKASKQKRDLVVIYMNPRTKRPDVNFHRDIPSWTLPSPEPAPKP